MLGSNTKVQGACIDLVHVGVLSDPLVGIQVLLIEVRIESFPTKESGDVRVLAVTSVLITHLVVLGVATIHSLAVAEISCDHPVHSGVVRVVVRVAHSIIEGLVEVDVELCVGDEGVQVIDECFAFSRITPNQLRVSLLVIADRPSRFRSPQEPVVVLRVLSNASVMCVQLQVRNL